MINIENQVVLSDWMIGEKKFDPEYMAKFEAILTQGNGYMGQRAALDERYSGETRNLFVTGTFDRFHESETTELPNLPDVTNIGIRVNSREFSLANAKVEAYSRTLNLRNGELTREAVCVLEENIRLRLKWRRMVSMTNRHLIASQLSITAQSSVEIQIVSGIDGRVTNSGTQHTVEGRARVYDGSLLEYPCTTLQSGVRVITHVTHKLFLDQQEQDASMAIVTGRRYIGGKYRVQLRAGQTLCFEKLAMVHTSRDMEYQDLPEESARQKVVEDGLAAFRGVSHCRYQELIADSSCVWEKLWQELDVQVSSQDIRDQLAIRFAIYHLVIMTNMQDSRIGIAAKGLSGEGYKGHSFWDTETFILPFFLYSKPEIARNLLEYRYKTISGAKELAVKRGYRGAMYPWESAWIADGDVTPDNLGVDLVTGEIIPCKTGEIEDHVSADVAFAVHQYWQATGDRAFMEQCGYEILLQTACFWTSRAKWVEAEERYEIHHVIGPDEYQVDVNNDAYTNYLAHRNIVLGLWALDELEKEKSLWEKLNGKLPLTGLKELFQEYAQKLYLPKPEPGTGILPQFDGYLEQEEIDISTYRNCLQVGRILQDYSFESLRNYQVAKQADVVQLMFLEESLFPEAVRVENYRYYEPRTLHDSSLSKAVHSVLASDLGLSEEAYKMFRGAAETDLGSDPHSSDPGIHSANMGGIWQAAVMGFGGLRMIDGCLRIAPHLPKEWREMRYQVNWKGNILAVKVTQEELLICNHGSQISLLTENGQVTIEAGQSFVLRR